jgi:hypothetical protein
MACKDINSVERFYEKCNVFVHNMDSELLDKFDVFFDFKRLTDGRYIMMFKKYRNHGRHPKTVAWLEFHMRRGVIDVSNNILGHVLNSMYNDGWN